MSRRQPNCADEHGRLAGGAAHQFGTMLCIQASPAPSAPSLIFQGLFARLQVLCGLELQCPMASPASDIELAFVLTCSYKILGSHKVASGSTQSRCPSPPSCLWAMFCLCPAPVLLKTRVRVTGTTHVRPQCPHLPAQPLLPGCMVLQHRVPCAQDIKLPCPPL